MADTSGDPGQAFLAMQDRIAELEAEVERLRGAIDPTDPDVLETIADDIRYDCLQTVYPAELEKMAARLRAALAPAEAGEAE